VDPRLPARSRAEEILLRFLRACPCPSPDELERFLEDPREALADEPDLKSRVRSAFGRIRPLFDASPLSELGDELPADEEDGVLESNEARVLLRRAWSSASDVLPEQLREFARLCRTDEELAELLRADALERTRRHIPWEADDYVRWVPEQVKTGTLIGLALESLHRTLVTDEDLEPPEMRSRESRVLPGTRIGPYRFVESIGSGSFAEVWLADQTAPRRQVAIKLLHGDRIDRSARRRFRTEIQALANLTDPGIVTLFAAHVAEEDPAVQQLGPFLVMEYVRGRTLTEFCDRHRLGIEQRLTLFLAIVRSVMHAHGRGVVHRDLKPANILVQLEVASPAPTTVKFEDDQGQTRVARPKILDFGLARAAHPNLRLVDGSLTAEGTFVGTPCYMAPEQVRQEPDGVDSRCDVFALGAILYELLAGAPPLTDAELKSRSVETPGGLPLAVESEVRVSLPERYASQPVERRAAVAHQRRESPGTLAKLLRGTLRTIPETCVRLRPVERYATASDLAADVAAYLEGRPLRAATPRRRTLVAAARRSLRFLLATAAIGAGYLGLADAGAEIPGGSTVRRWLDSAEATLFRPVPTDDDLSRAAIEVGEQIATDLSAASRDGFFAHNLTEASIGERSLWASSQAIAALGRWGHGSLPPSLWRAYETLYYPPLDEIVLDPDSWDAVPPPDWLPRHQSRAKPFRILPDLAWGSIALAVLDHDPDGPAGDFRRRTLRIRSALELMLAEFWERRSGACRMFEDEAAEVVRSEVRWARNGNPYSAALILEFLWILHERDGGLNPRREAWAVSIAERLLETYDAEGERPGWRRSPNDGDKFRPDGLALQCWHVLMRLACVGLIEVPPEMFDHVAERIVVMSRRHHAADPGSLEFIRDVEGSDALAKEEIRFLWHPWAIAAADAWLDCAALRPVDPAQVAAVRRAAHDLTADMGRAAVEGYRANEERTFIAAEMLYCLALMRERGR